MDSVFWRSDWLLNLGISYNIHWFTSSSSERATPNSFILGDPGAVSQVGGKDGTKVFKYGRRAPGYRRSPNCFQKFKRMLLPIGHKKCFVSLCPIGEQFLLSSFREFVHDGCCLATLARFVNQACVCKGNFYFLLSWPETKELPMSRKNVWDAINRSNWICPENILFFWRITMSRK